MCDFRNGEEVVLRIKRVIILVGKGMVAPYINSDIALAFKSLGVEVKLMPLLDNGTQYREADEFGPDAVFSLDNKGLNFDWVRKLGVFRVTWFVDNPFYFLNEKDEELFIFSIDKFYVKYLREIGFPKSFYLPMGVNADIFKPTADRYYKYDISFVASVSGMEMPKELSDKDKADLENALNYVDPFDYENTANMFVKSMLDFYKSIYTDFCLSDKKRLVVMKLLVKYNSAIYSDKKFDFIPDNIYGGKIDYHTELPALYNSSRINISATRPQLVAVPNQRVFDISACESFFLTDARPAVKEYFPECYREVSYYSEEDLKKKIEYFLKNESERESISSYLYSETIERHTYGRRIGDMLSLLET